MHVIVVGAGIIGVCTAYFLRRAGMDVTVVERRPGVAQETSFANAGVMAPSYVAPWAQPGMPGKVAAYLFKAEAPIVFRPAANLALWNWIRRWLTRVQPRTIHAQQGAHATARLLQPGADPRAAQAARARLRAGHGVPAAVPHRAGSRALGGDAQDAHRTGRRAPAAHRRRGARGGSRRCTRSRRSRARCTCRTTKRATARSSRTS